MAQIWGILYNQTTKQIGPNLGLAYSSRGPHGWGIPVVSFRNDIRSYTQFAPVTSEDPVRLLVITGWWSIARCVYVCVVACNSRRGRQSFTYFAAGALPRQASSARTTPLDARQRPATTTGWLGRGDQPSIHLDAVQRQHQEDGKFRNSRRRYLAYETGFSASVLRPCWPCDRNSIRPVKKISQNWVDFFFKTQHNLL